VSTGLCLHIGLNRVDADIYNGWRGELDGCVNDAREMLKIATRGGFRPVLGDGLLLDDQATSTRIFGTIKAAAARLSVGDVFLLTFSGHGLQQDGEAELDHMDEAWVLFDRIVIDDHISAALQAFEAGVRVVVVADTCHAAGDIDDQFLQPKDVKRRFRIIPGDVMDRLVDARPGFLDANTATGAARAVPKASILLVAACSDKELAQDNTPNGVFTSFVMQAATTTPSIGYEALVAKVKESTKPFGQNPELRQFGPKAGIFLTDPVFTVPK
jgi:metacaspase-1